MEGRATTSAPELVEQSSEELPVLAVDRWGSFAAAFRFAVFTGGEWYADALYARLTDGRWDELGSGGSHGDGWDTPWRPPTDGWRGDVLYVMGSGGLDVQDEHDILRELLVVYGFVSPAVKTIEITGPAYARAVDVISPV